MKTYIALIHKDPKSDFGVSFPDFPGCVTAGRDLDEAYHLAEEALAFHIEGMIDDGETIPEPSSLEEIMAASENRDGVAAVIPAPNMAKTVRVNITLSDQLLAQIDKEAESRGVTRSGFLAEAARKAMGDSDATYLAVRDALSEFVRDETPGAGDAMSEPRGVPLERIRRRHPLMRGPKK